MDAQQALPLARSRFEAITGLAVEDWRLEPRYTGGPMCADASLTAGGKQFLIEYRSVATAEQIGAVLHQIRTWNRADSRGSIPLLIFRRYREKTQKKYLSGLPLEIQDAVRGHRWAEIASYLNKQQSDLEEHPFEGRGLDLRTLGAIALMSERVTWKRFAGIAYFTNPSPVVDSQYRNDLPTDLSRSPMDAQAALHRLGR